MAERLKILFPRPDAGPEAPGLDRIRSLLRASRMQSGERMGRPEPPPEAVANARYHITLHALASAAAAGHKGYEAYADAVSEQEVLDSLPKLSEAAIAELKADLEYISRHSPYESVRIAASFYLDE